MIKVGVIGTGYGKEVVTAFNSFPNSKVIAITGRDKKKTDNFAKKIGAEYSYINWKKLVTNPEVDLVCIVSPSNLHKEMFDFAVSKNKHILVEKPAGISPKEIEEMQQLVQDYPKHVFVNHAHRFNPVILDIKKRIAQGEIGEVSSVRMTTYMNYYSHPNDAYTWWHEKKNSGGYIYVVGVHMIDLARDLVGMKKVIKGKIINRVIPDEKYPTQPTSAAQFSAQYEMENEITLQMFATSYSFGYKNTEIQVLGNKGVLFYDDKNGLRMSLSNHQPLEKISIKDHLEHIKVGRSLMSQSLKFLVEAYVKLLNGEKVDTSRFCNLETAHENLDYLFWE